MRSIKKIAFFGCLFLLPVFSFGWGVLGHRIVGQIAESYLTPKAKIQVQKILGNESIALVSTWADFIKSDSEYQYIYNWHFINRDSGLTKAQLQDYLKKDTAADLFTKTNFLVRELKNKHLSMDRKRMYLKLLIHFVGDIHQPFHVGRREDLGGNKIKLTWFSTPTNLHALWDDQLINFQQLSYTEYSTAINHTTSKQRLAWQKQPISEWFIESLQIAERLYSEVTPDQKLSYRYNYDNIQILNERLLKAGVRLAGVLNELFGQ
ncbi:MAG TPA: S1/P1 nuclease [Chitinophagaceae bacterium]|jgi:nuclease S1|nr:S1/P1 nuclease [Chitinophagaceae bacterium]